MWTFEQRQRLAVEHQILQREGFDQFSDDAANPRATLTHGL